MACLSSVFVRTVGGINSSSVSRNFALSIGEARDAEEYECAPANEREYIFCGIGTSGDLSVESEIGLTGATICRMSGVAVRMVCAFSAFVCVVLSPARTGKETRAIGSP